MINEEQYIHERLGRKNPFRVPEGYFDSLTAEVMSRLPEQDSRAETGAAVQSGQSQKQPEQARQSRLVSIRPWLYAAACLFVALFTAAVYFAAPDAGSQQMAVATTTTTTVTTQENYVDEVADYVMADNMDIYACLASEY